jgi:LuxR family maltose regulon positive regulatory protein
VWSLIFTYRYAEADTELAGLEDLLLNAGGCELSPVQQADWDMVMRKTASMRVIYYAFSLNTRIAGQRAKEWLARWTATGEPYEIGGALNVVAYAAYFEGNYEQAVLHLAIAKEYHQDAQLYDGFAFTEMVHALVELERGDIQRTEEIVVSALEVVAANLGAYSYGCGLLILLHAQVCYEQNQTDKAKEMLDNFFILTNGRNFGVSAMCASYFVKARLLWMRGEIEQADDLLAETVATGERLGLERMRLMASAERIHLRLKNGQPELALQLAKSIGLQGDFAASAMHTVLRDKDIGIRLIDIRMKLSLGHTAPALLLLNDLLAEAKRQGRKIWQAKLLAIKAQAHLAAGNLDAARRALSSALQIGEEQGLCRSLVDEGQHVRTLVREIIDRRKQLEDRMVNAISMAYLMQVMHASGGPTSDVTKTSLRTATIHDARILDLSDRELQILKLLSIGMNNRDLAAQVFLSEATVKWHLRRIYTKLDVGNRTSAVAVARAQGLV